MKKIIALLAAMAVIMMGMLALAGTASATDDDADSDNKKVTICHFTNENASHQYNRITVSANSIVKNNGHAQHDGGKDVIPSFTYVTKGGATVTFPAQGDQSLLAFENCEQPKVDEKIAVPAVTFVDVCGVENDVLSLTPGTGYTVNAIHKDGLFWVVTASANDGFIFEYVEGVSDDGKEFSVSKTFTNEDCDLPETGGVAKFNTALGAGIVALIIAAGVGLFLYRRKS